MHIENPLWLSYVSPEDRIRKTPFITPFCHTRQWHSCGPSDEIAMSKLVWHDQAPSCSNFMSAESYYFSLSLEMVTSQYE